MRPSLLGQHFWDPPQLPNGVVTPSLRNATLDAWIQLHSQVPNKPFTDSLLNLKLQVIQVVGFLFK